MVTLKRKCVLRKMKGNQKKNKWSPLTKDPSSIIFLCIYSR